MTPAAFAVRVWFVHRVALDMIGTYGVDHLTARVCRKTLMTEREPCTVSKERQHIESQEVFPAHSQPGSDSKKEM